MTRWGTNLDVNVALPEQHRAAIVRSAADRDLGGFVAVAHAPSRAGDRGAPRSHGGSPFGGFACMVLGILAVALGIVSTGSIASHIALVLVGVLIALAGRWLVRDSRRERAVDTFHFANGFVQWNSQTQSATAYRWSDFVKVSDRFFTTRLFGAAQSVDYRATFQRADGELITLSATAPSKKRALRDTEALRAMVAASRHQYAAAPLDSASTLNI